MRTESGRATRVLHATECLASGTLDVIRALVNVLAEQGVEQTLVFSRRAETPSDVAGLFASNVRLIEVAPAKGMNLSFALAMVRTLRREVHAWQPSHVHLHSSRAGFIGRLALRSAPSTTLVLYSPHGLSFLDPNRPVVNAVFRLLEGMANTSNSQVVACSAGEAALLQQLTEKVPYILENPADAAFFSATRRGALPASTITSVGRLSRQKAPEVFAAVAQRVKEARPGVRAIWVGDGDPALRATLVEAGCEVTGWLPRQEVLRILEGTDVYVQTSRWEGLPISVIQAMACGIPAVVTNVVGNRDAVQHGTSGLIAADSLSLANLVELLLADSGMRETLAQGARREAIRRFSPKAFNRSARALFGLMGPTFDSAPAASRIADVAR
jgi:glycosyltransferase involved in cell wall biosynthesis